MSPSSGRRVVSTICKTNTTVLNLWSIIWVFLLPAPFQITLPPLAPSYPQFFPHSFLAFSFALFYFLCSLFLFNTYSLLLQYGMCCLLGVTKLLTSRALFPSLLTAYRSHPASTRRRSNLMWPWRAQNKMAESPFLLSLASSRGRSWGLLMYSCTMTSFSSVMAALRAPRLELPIQNHVRLNPGP